MTENKLLDALLKEVFDEEKSPKRKLAILVRDEIITREFSVAVARCISEIGDIEAAWKSIKKRDYTSRWWYCVIKYFDHFMQDHCKSYISNMNKNNHYSYLSIALRSIYDNINIKKAIERFPRIMSDKYMIKKLLLSVPTNDSLDLLDNNTCTESEKIDIWKFAISVSAVYILYAPPEIRNSKSTQLQLKIGLFAQTECDIDWTEKASDKMFTELAKVVDICHTKQLSTDRLMLLSELYVTSKNYHNFQDDMLENEIFLDRVANGLVRPHGHLHERLIRCGKHTVTDLDDFMQNYNSADFYMTIYDDLRLCNVPLVKEIFIKYPEMCHRTACAELKLLYETFEKHEIPLFRRNIAILARQNSQYEREDKFRSLYKSLFGAGISMDDEYEAYKRFYVNPYEEKNFRHDIIARYNTDICRRAVEINKENIFYARSIEPSFYECFFDKNPDMLLRKEICWFFMIAIICMYIPKYIRQPLIMFNIMNGAIDITRLPERRRDEIMAALFEVVDEDTKNTLIMSKIKSAKYSEDMPAITIASHSCSFEKYEYIKNNIDRIIFD
mgnify:CR=1 FL=1